MFVLTHLVEKEITGKAEAVREITSFNRMVWDAKAGQHVAIGPSEPNSVLSTRNTVADGLYEVTSESSRRFRNFIGYENAPNAVQNNDLWAYSEYGLQQPLQLSVDDVCGLLCDGLVVRRDCLTLWMLVSFAEYVLILWE